MVLFWRGFGIVVPIIFGICLWICSYWYDDLRIGNWDYTGWAMFWAGIVNLLIGALFKMNYSDVEDLPREPGEVMPSSRKHDFFWIPVWIWGIIMIAWGIYLFSGEGEDDTAFSTEEVDDGEPQVIYQGERKVQFYNPTADTVYVEVYNASGENVLADTIPPTYMRWKVLDAGLYTVSHDLGEEEIEVTGSDMEENERYDVGWYVIGGETDLILLDVQDAIRSDINREELAAIDWKSKIEKRYKGGSYLIPRLRLHDFKYYTVYGPGLDLPMELEEDEKVYAIIPIPEDQKTTEEYLDQMVEDVCF